jgi:polyribonucleotide nucleotidyltransferase
LDLKSMEIGLEDGAITLETGKVAKQADGAVTVRCGDTIVLVTVMGSKEPLEGVDFFPLVVDVEERMYAAGKIPGGFFKREGRPSEKSILNARLVDRPIRPSFPKAFRYEIQIIATTFSVDQVNPPDVLALIGASAALTISDIPFDNPIAGVRIGRVDGRWIVNPTFQELELSELDVIIAGNKSAILMVEAGATEVSEEVVVEALQRGHEAVKQIIAKIEEFREMAGVPKRELVAAEIDPEIDHSVRELAMEKLKEALRIADKQSREERISELRQQVKDEISASLPEGSEKEKDISSALKQLEKEEARRMVLQENIRMDGRGLDEIRPVSCEVGVLPRTHGTGLFTRGQTQVLTALTLGTVGEGQIVDGLGIEESKRYMHHYNFPPFSTGEIGMMRGPRRREIGHGALAERALLPVIPDEEEFPDTIRLVSEVLESNGSSSMASVCGSTLALMDAGVPIKAPVAGIAMGLVKEADEVAILTDILGMEDALGDMDFKVAGTERGITALQMDMKVEGVDQEVLGKALAKAREARLFILGKIGEVIAEPRDEVSEFAPRIITMKINQDKIREVIGPGGKMIRSIIDETGATIDIQDDGTIYVGSKDEEGGEKAKAMIELITKEPKRGEQYQGTVTKTTNFGAFVEILPGKEGLVHISRLARGRVAKVEDVVKVGDKILVEVVDIDRQNRIALAAVNQ